MTTREERQQARTARLLDQVELAAAAWADADYQEGIGTGRHGVVRVSVERRRIKAKKDFKEIVARLRRATLGR